MTEKPQSSRKSDAEAFARLVKQVKQDAQLFHALTFDTETAIRGLTFLSDSQKERLIALGAERVFAGIVGVERLFPVAGCDPTCGGDSCVGTCTGSCNDTCSSSSCMNTCTGSSCINTCMSSCESTCSSGSCGYTTDVVARQTLELQQVLTDVFEVRQFFRATERG